MNPAILRTIFQAFGDIESVRVLSHKNCGFVNFDHQEDAVKARKMLQNKEILGPGTGAVRIGFAKVPPNNPDEAEELNKNQAVPDNASPTFTPTTLPTTPANTNNQKLLSTSTLPNNETNTGADNNYQAAQWATSMTMPNTMHAPSQQTGQPNLYTAIATERLFIMQQLGFEPIETAKGKSEKYSRK
jgi:hypothetical protein